MSLAGHIFLSTCFYNSFQNSSELLILLTFRKCMAAIVILDDFVKKYIFCCRFSFGKASINYALTVFDCAVFLILPAISNILSRIKLRQQGTVTI